MHRKKEPCRNFQRGSCQYGANCKFWHDDQHQKPNNPFGIGRTNQQQPTFGSLDNSRPHGHSSSAPKHQNQFKPGENKWNRYTPLAVANSNPTRQSDNKLQEDDHKCTDPVSCKRLIAKDFKDESPLWKLTCYGHWKYLPCDIVGDISYEELRVAAYVEAKQGLNFPSIIARERSLLNSKLIEFDNLLRNSQLTSSNGISTSPNPFSVSNTNASVVTVQNKEPPSVSSFSQLGFSVNQGSNKNFFGQSPGNFGHPRPFQTSSGTSVGLGVNNPTIGTQGLFGRQLPPSNFTKFDNGSIGSGGSPISASLAAPQQLPSSASNFSTFSPDGLNPAVSLIGRTSLDDLKTESLQENMSIWLKEKWNPGEIPEVAPPDGFI